MKEVSEDNNTSLLTRPEKEKKVIELLKQGKTFVQIAKEIHVSFGDIGRIKRELIGEQEGEKSKQSSSNANKKAKSIDSQAFLLFLKGKSPVEVAVELNLPADEVERLTKDYWRLKGLNKLPAIFDNIKKDFRFFFRLYQMVIDNKIKKGQFLELLKYADKIKTLKNEVEKWESRLDDLKFQNGDEEAEVRSLMKEATELKENTSELKKEKANLESDVLSLRLDVHDEVKKLQQIRVQANSLITNMNWHVYGRNY